MHEQFLFYLIVVLVIAFLIMLSRKMKIAYPILLVCAGVGISVIPDAPRVTIEPDLIFLIFLPPLLFEAASSISWKELWRWRRIVSSFAFIVVFFSATCVALVANYFIPYFSLALGFLLGGIVSPPDAVSAGAILKFVKIPKRISSILEGESLLNDASSLIIVRFAMIAVATGQFVWYNAALDFIWMVVGGVGIGLIVAWLFIQIPKKLPTDANIDVLLTLVAPYIMYIAAEEVHSSGVLAVVSGGLLLSNKIYEVLDSSSRVRGVNVWESFVFILNGLVFMLIGLELPEIVEGIRGEGIAISTAFLYGVLITVVLMVVRIIACYGAVITTLIARNFIKVADPNNPGWKGPLIIGWSGMRGVVSLAAALSIPRTLEDGSAFPGRDMILFITFVVIFLTLVVQGLTLPWMIRKFNIPDPDAVKSEEEWHREIKAELSREALSFLEKNYQGELAVQPVLQKLARKWKDDLTINQQYDLNSNCKAIYRNVLEHQRQWLLKKNRSHELLNEDIIRMHLRELDFDEERLELS